MSLKTIAFNEGSVEYHIEGQGPGLVLVHGTGGNAETNWGHLVEELSRYRTVVRPNYAGSGNTTDAGGPLTTELIAAQVIAAAQAAGATPFDLVGFSLGAGIATFLAAEYSEVVRSVILLAGFLSGADSRFTSIPDAWRFPTMRHRNHLQDQGFRDWDRKHPRDIACHVPGRRIDPLLSAAVKTL